MTIMATSAYLSQGGGPPSSDQEEGVMNLVNTSNSQGYSLPREQVVGFRTSFSYAEKLGHLQSSEAKMEMGFPEFCWGIQVVKNLK